MRLGRSCFTLARLRSRVETAGKMKISRIELASRPKTFPIVDHHPSIPQRDQTVVAKRFEASIHVHGTETEEITKFSLGDREFIATVDFVSPIACRRRNTSQRRSAIRW